MKNYDENEQLLIEICNHCGRNVSCGSGFFVNRVPDFNDIATRIENGLKFPLGDFVCQICDEKIEEEWLNEWPNI
jgi:hypothetical protein